MKEITLKHGVALMDDDDFERLKAWKWWSEIHHKGSPRESIRVRGRDTSIPYRSWALKKLHRVVMGTTDPDILVDHINHNPLDNRKENLRLCTTSENKRNSVKQTLGTSRFKGVHLYQGKWWAKITVSGKRVYLGRYDTEEQAAKAYVDAAQIHHGEFACTKSDFSLDTFQTNVVE